MRSDMYTQTHLCRRGAIYYFRAKVPVDLRRFHEGRREVKVSLKTKDKQEAVILARRKSLEWTEECRALRHKVQPQTTRVAYDDSAIQSICDQYRYLALDGDSKSRQEGYQDADHERITADRAEVDAELRQALSRGKTDLILHALNDFLWLLGLKPPLDSAGLQKLSYRFLETVAATHRQQMQRDQGEVVPVPPAPSSPVSGNASERLDALLKDWDSAVKRSNRTVNDTTATITDLKTFLRNPPAAEITRKDVIRYRDHLLAQGLHFRTVRKKIGFLSSVFRVAVENEKLVSNPAQLVRVHTPKVSDVSRVPYDLEDIRKILQSPIYSRRHRPRGGGGEAAAWLPLLGMFTGARLGELGQLRVDDIRQDDLGWYIEITDAHKGQRVKTNSSRRRIPIHTCLIEAGLLRYRESLIRRGVERLFPALKEDSKGDITGNWSKWWGRYARHTIGIKDTRKVFHSFRHWYKDRCRETGISEEIHDALTGHTGTGGVGRQYGGQYPLLPLFAAVRKIHYDIIVPVVFDPC